MVQEVERGRRCQRLKGNLQQGGQGRTGHGHTESEAEGALEGVLSS